MRNWTGAGTGEGGPLVGTDEPARLGEQKLQGTNDCNPLNLVRETVQVAAMDEEIWGSRMVLTVGFNSVTSVKLFLHSGWRAGLSS